MNLEPREHKLTDRESNIKALVESCKELIYNIDNSDETASKSHEIKKILQSVTVHGFRGWIRNTSFPSAASARVVVALFKVLFKVYLFESYSKKRCRRAKMTIAERDVKGVYIIQVKYKVFVNTPTLELIRDTIETASKNRNSVYEPDYKSPFI